MRKLLIAVLVLIVAVVGAFFGLLYFWPSAGLDRRPQVAEVPPLKPMSRVSRVVAPTAITLSAIQKAVEAAAPRNLDGKRDDPLGRLLTNSEIGWTMTRGPMAVTGRAEGVTVSAPMTGTFRLTGQIGDQAGQIGGAIGNLLGQSIGREVQNLTGKMIDQRTDLSANVLVTSRPALMPNWRVEPNLGAQVSVAAAAISLSGLKVNVGGEVKPLLERAVNEQLKLLQARVRDNPFIEEAARREWAKMCRAIPIGGAELPQLWLEVRPMKAFAAQPAVDAKAVNLVIGVEANTRIVPSETKPDCPFPAQLEIVPQVGKGRVAIALPIDLPFTEVNRLLEAQLKGRTFPEDGSGPAAVTVNKATVTPSGNRLLISLRVKVREQASFLGLGADATVYVWGRPVLDPEKQILRMTDIELDVDSEAALGLVGAAARATAPYLRDALAEYAAVDLKPFAASALKSVDAAIADFRKGNDAIRIDAKASELRLTGIDFDAKTLRVIAEASGTVGVTVTSLPAQ